MQKVPGAGFLIVGGSDLGCVEEMAQGLQQQPQVARQRGSEALALPRQAQVARREAQVHSVSCGRGRSETQSRS